MPEVVRGKKTKVELVSVLGEVARISLQQGLEFTPSFTEENIPEFDNEAAALIIQTLDKFDSTLTYLESSDKTIAAILMGLAIASAVVPINVANFKEVAWFANMKGADGKIFRSFAATNGTVKGAPVSIAVDGGKNAKQLQISHPQIYDIQGAAVYHEVFESTDFTKDTTNYESPAFTKTPVALPAHTIADTEQKVLFVRKNGAIVTDGFTIVTGNKLDIGTVAPGVSDIWEVFYCYDDTAA